MDSLSYLFKVKKEDVFLICPYLESFEGLAAIRTPAPAAGPHSTIKLLVPPSFKNDFEKVMANLGKKVWLERVA